MRQSFRAVSLLAGGKAAAVLPLAVLAMMPAVAAMETRVATFERFVAGWSGAYDNARQHAAQLGAGVPEAQRNPRLELRIVRVDLPAFGPQAFYAEWFAPGTDAPPVRQRIYAFERDAAGRILLRLHIFPTDAAFVARTAGAWRDPTRLRGLTPADMAPLPGCDVTFGPDATAPDLDGGTFAGEMAKGACRFPALDDPSREIYSWSQMKKSDRTFSYKDGWFNLDGTVYRSWTAEWFVFEKR